MSRVNRMVKGGLAALALAGLLITTQWHPLCALYEPGEAMWYLLACFIDGPPPDGGIT